MIKQSQIRNFCIIAHIDHGKSTLADRMLEKTGTIESRKMREQYLDMMDLERERGITIKLQPVYMKYKLPESLRRTFNFQFSTFNLIDTPGHVDFSYEVSRSLAAVEGAILLVDATQGIQAQTLSHLEIAKKENLVIIPVVNKIDSAAAEPEKTASELRNLLNCRKEEIIFSSGKTGEGVEEILKAIVERIPPPKGKKEVPFRALIFDSFYDSHRGVVAFVRMVEGELSKGEKVKMWGTGAETKIADLGIFKPELSSQEKLVAGEIGYLISGLKDTKLVKIGDTIVPYPCRKKITPLPGYRIPKPKVFASFFPHEGKDFEKLRRACEKLTLNDSSLVFKKTSFLLLGQGMEAGFLGNLHLDIVRERLEREYNLSLIVSQPSVEYKVKVKDKEILIKNAIELPEDYKEIAEPYCRIEIITPNNYLSNIIEIMKTKRGKYITTKVLGGDRSILKFIAPLSEIIFGFYDQLKSVSSGFASLNYQVVGFKKAKLTRLDFLLNGKIISPFSAIVAEDKLEKVARAKVKKLQQILPRQNFEIKIQAKAGGRIIAAEKIPAFRKDVVAKLYGGDRTRKDKLLKKQKAGKKKMKQLGKIEVPEDVFLKFLQ